MKNGFMVSIPVSNLENSISFYKDLIGFELLNRVKISESVRFAFMLYEDSIEIQLIERRGESVPSPSSSVTLSFQTADIQSKLSEVVSYSFNSEAQLISPNPTVSILPFTDPDGVSLSFIEER